MRNAVESFNISYNNDDTTEFEVITPEMIEAVTSEPVEATTNVSEGAEPRFVESYQQDAQASPYEVTRQTVNAFTPEEFQIQPDELDEEMRGYIAAELGRMTMKTTFDHL